MLEQIWKNVMGNTFFYKVEDGKVVATVPRGSHVRIYDFALLVGDMEKALGRHIDLVGKLDADGLLCLTLSEVDAPVEAVPAPIDEAVVDEEISPAPENGVEEVPQPKKHTRRKNTEN